MEYVYASLLLHSAGKGIDEENVKKVLEAAGIKPDEAKVKALVSSLEGVNIDEELKKSSAPVAAIPVQQQAEQKPAEKKEEDVEKKAEEASAGLASLFG